MSTDARLVVQHLVVDQAQRGTPLSPTQAQLLLQHTEALYAVNHPRHLIASHAAALLRCFHARIPIGVPQLSPTAASASASAALLQQQQNQQQLMQQEQANLAHQLRLARDQLSRYVNAYQSMLQKGQAGTPMGIQVYRAIQHLQVLYQALQHRVTQQVSSQQLNSCALLSAPHLPLAPALEQQQQAALPAQANNFSSMQLRQSPAPRLRLTELPNEILGLIYSFVPSNDQRNFFTSCKGIHNCGAVQSQIFRLYLPADAAVSDILRFPKGCTLKALVLSAGQSINARMQSLVNLKHSGKRAEELFASVQELKIIAPEVFDQERDPYPIPEELPSLFVSLSKLKFKSQVWTAELQALLITFLSGLNPPRQLKELMFEYRDEFNGMRGLSGVNLARVPNVQGLTSLGISCEAASINPQAAEPVMQLMKLERLFLANASNKRFLEHAPYVPKMLASLPKLSYLHMHRLPSGFVVNMPMLRVLHLRVLVVQELHELHQSLVGCLPNLHTINLDILDAGDLAHFSADECKFSPTLMKGFALDLSSTTLMAGSYYEALNVEQLLLAVSGLVSMGPPFADIKAIHLFNRVLDKVPVPPGIMCSLACLLPSVTKLTLVGYWSNEGLGPCKQALREFKSLAELRLITSQEYRKCAFEAFDSIYHKLNRTGRICPVDLCLCARDMDPAGLVWNDGDVFTSDDESDLSYALTSSMSDDDISVSL